MAIEYTDREKASLVNQIYESLERGLPILQSQADSVQSMTTEGKKKLQKDKDLNAATSLAVKGFKDLTKSMYDGQQGAVAMNGAVDMVTAAVDVLIAVIPGGLLLKGALLAANHAINGFVKVSNEQADALFKTYQDLSKNGLATAGGMTDIYNNMQRFNYGIKELGDMTALLKENSVALANFGGTAATGTKAFATAADEIQHSDIGKTFQMMGKTPDEINRGITMFIKSQQSIGIQNSEIQRNLAGKSTEYIMKMDLLTKLTGLSAEKLQANLDEANSQDAFNQVQYELKRKADAGDQKAKEQFERNETLAKKYAGTEFGKELFASIGGDISSMGKMMMTAPNVARLIQTGEFTVADIENQAAKDIVQTRDRFGNLIKLNAMQGDLYSGKEMSMFTSRFADGTAKQQEEMAKAEQLLQQKGLDPTTKKMVLLRIENQKTRDSFQNLVNKGVGPATTALEMFASVANKIAGIVPGTGSDVTDQNKQKEKETKTEKNTANANISTDTKQILNAIKTNESEGNYEIQAPNSSASGAYQFIDSTWQALTKKYGMGQEYSRAKLAPKEIQDAIAEKYVDEIMKNNKNDPRAVFNTWYTGNAKGKISQEAMDINGGKTATQMTDKVMGIMAKQKGEATAPKTPDSSKATAQAPAGTATDSNDLLYDSDTGARKNTLKQAPPTMAEPLPGNQPPWLQRQQISGANGWDGMLTGPSSGYQPNIIMHGTEDLKITPAKETVAPGETIETATNTMLQQQTEKLDVLIGILGNQQENDLVAQQLIKLEELSRSMQDQVNVSTKILQASR